MTWHSDDAKTARRKIIDEKDRFFVLFEGHFYGGWIETTRQDAERLIDVGFTVQAGDGDDAVYLTETK